MRVLKLNDSLTNLFNLSLQHGIFPDTWKQANVIPIFKKGDKSSPNNYRPVSLLSFVGKVMEKCILKHMYNYFRDSDLIYKFQSGFLPGCSTTHHLVHLYHSISEAFDKGLKVQMVFGDISKAFDKVWHAGLLFKLKNMGITEELLAWAWAQQWIVSFSALKTNSMVVNYRNITPPNNLKMYNQELQNIPYSKHLGVTLQQNLKWDKHFEEISIKPNKRLDILNLLSFKLSRNSCEILYFTFVRSVLEYSNELFSNATKENLELFDKIQKRAGKIVSGAIRGTSSIKIYTELSWESLQSRRENKMIILYSDILHDRLLLI